MTVGELRKALRSVDDKLEVIVRAEEERDDGDVSFVGGVHSAAVEFGCTDRPAFIIGANADVEPPGEDEEE